MERGDRAALATFHAPGFEAAAGPVSLPEDAAHHARVRRLANGDRVRLSDGAGLVAEGAIARIAKTSLEVAIDPSTVARVPSPAPVHLLVPIGDRDRMLWLAEKAAELALTSWTAVRWSRSRSVSPRGEGPAFADKVRKRMIAALEQSHGAWLPEIGAELEPADAVARFAGLPRVLLDASGEAMPLVVGGAGTVAIALGPEGGLTPEERGALREAGWRAAALSPTVLRFETAALAALAVARAALLGSARDPSGTSAGR
ncbi:MAG TPA: RsmE family RNA methyltransferase [Gemmatimonadaceae bacterium]|nr:RsmE family RNA methyltransferase [Gemmatimonadaceae bacterium]